MVNNNNEEVIKSTEEAKMIIKTEHNKGRAQ